MNAPPCGHSPRRGDGGWSTRRISDLLRAPAGHGVGTSESTALEFEAEVSARSRPSSPWLRGNDPALVRQTHPEFLVSGLTAAHDVLQSDVLLCSGSHLLERHRQVITGDND